MQDVRVVGTSSTEGALRDSRPSLEKNQCSVAGAQAWSSGGSLANW